MYSKILVPLDGSPLAEAALRHAAELARGTGAEILLLEVAQDGLAAVPEARVHATPVEVYGGAIRGMKYLRKVADRLRRGGITVRCGVLEGDPASAILSFAHRENVDLIVMGTHRRSGIARAMHGSVAEAVAITTRRPVVLVKGGAPAGNEAATAA